MTNLDSILKNRDITLPTNVHLAKAMFVPVVRYGCESWTTKKAESRRIDALELWCWRRLFRVPWKAKRSNQSILKEIGPEYSLEGLMLKLKFQFLAPSCEELTHLKRPWCWKDWRREEKGTTKDEMVGWHHRLNGHGFERTPGVGDGQGGLECCSPWSSRVRNNWATDLNWYDLASEVTKHHFHLSVERIVTSPYGFKETRHRLLRWIEYHRIFSCFCFCFF